MAQQKVNLMTALQSTAPGTPLYTEHVKSQNQKSKSPGALDCRAGECCASKAERRIVMKLEDFETELELFDSFTKERFPESSQGYTQEYRLYLQIKPNGNIIGYAVGESHCGHGQGCFWSDEDIRPCSLEEFNSLRRAVSVPLRGLWFLITDQLWYVKQQQVSVPLRGCVKQTRKFYSLTTEYITNKRTVQYITLFGGLENAI